MQDINKMLRTLVKYVWIGTGAVFVCYMYFVGSITFSIIKQQDLEQTNRLLISSMSQEELTYLALQKDLTVSQGQLVGLVPAPAISFTASQRAFAWNVGR
jgi:uncharacterized membrane protein